VRCSLCKVTKVQGTGSSAVVNGSFSQSEKEGIHCCILSVLGYVSETLAVKVEDMVRKERRKQMMVRWMCGVNLTSKIFSAELNSWLSIECITVRIGLVTWIKRIVKIGFQRLEVLKFKELRDKGMGKKTWDEFVKQDLVEFGLYQDLRMGFGSNYLE